MFCWVLVVGGAVVIGVTTINLPAKIPDLIYLDATKKNMSFLIGKANQKAYSFVCY